MRKQYAPFEKKRTGELHEVILQDDGIARLADTLKSIRMNIDKFGFSTPQVGLNSEAPKPTTNS
jgi:hypothetical protein